MDKIDDKLKKLKEYARKIFPNITKKDWSFKIILWEDRGYYIEYVHGFFIHDLGVIKIILSYEKEVYNKRKKSYFVYFKYNNKMTMQRKINKKGGLKGDLTKEWKMFFEIVEMTHKPPTLEEKENKKKMFKQFEKLIKLEEKNG